MIGPKTALLAALFLLPACSSDVSGPSVVQFRMIGRSWLLARSRFNESGPGLSLIRDQAAWNSFKADVQDLRPPSGDPNDSMPMVDFTIESAVVLWLGTRTDSSYSVEVAGVSGTGSGLTVRAVEAQSCGGALTVITYPLAVLAVPRGYDVRAEWSRTPPCR
jgi:hypothetical protein